MSRVNGGDGMGHTSIGGGYFPSSPLSPLIEAGTRVQLTWAYARIPSATCGAWATVLRTMGAGRARVRLDDGAEFVANLRFLRPAPAKRVDWARLVFGGRSQRWHIVNSPEALVAICGRQRFDYPRVERSHRAPDKDLCGHCMALYLKQIRKVVERASEAIATKEGA